MRNLQDVWQTRLTHYTNELQKYMRYIFTGHIAIVIVFLLGAGGYQYSEWLTVVQPDFPAALIVGVVMGVLVMFSQPATLLKEPDAVYLLPLEKKMPQYFAQALRFSFVTSLPVLVIVYVAFIPLLKAVTPLSTTSIWLGATVVLVMKYMSIHSEFAFRYFLRGRFVWLDRLVRFALVVLTLATYLNGWYYGLAIGVITHVIYWRLLTAKTANQPFPYEHFITIEQNRMLRFYRFANYFTDVPHLRGAIRRRKWLDMVYNLAPYGKKNTQRYLTWRLFIRTNDHFYLWVRLTFIAALLAAFVDIMFVRFIIAGALSFATTLQLQQALTNQAAFRMDMLYPVPATQKNEAATSIVRLLTVVQAIIVMVSHITQPYFYVTGVIMIAVGLVTQQVMKK